MATLTELKQAYEANLGSSTPVASFAQANDAYELYVFSLVVRAAKEEGGTIGFKSRSGTSSPNPMVFRTSPGRIFSVSPDYSHATISFPRQLAYEIHLGVYVQGKAGVSHECDVFVIDASEAEFCRRARVNPKQGAVMLTIECKFYAARLGIAVGRHFLVVTIDLGNDGRFLASNTDGPSVDRVLAYHKRQRLFSLTPLDTDKEKQAVAMLRSVFRNVKARRG